MVWFMVFNTTSNNTSVISWQSPLLVEENRLPRGNQTCRKSDKLYHILYTSPWTGFELTTLVVIGTDCTGSLKSNYHTIPTTTAPIKLVFSPCVSWGNVCHWTSINMYLWGGWKFNVIHKAKKNNVCLRSPDLP